MFEHRPPPIQDILRGLSNVERTELMKRDLLVSVITERLTLNFRSALNINIMLQS